MANNIAVYDCSLRLNARTEGMALSFKEKLEIAKKLGELNVDVVEIGPISEDKAEETLVKTICACLKTTISCAVGNTEESIERAYKLIDGAKNKRLLLSIPVSPVQMEYFVSKKPKAVLELLATLVKKCVSLCPNVEVSLEDATRADSTFLYSAIKTAIENGAKYITLTDLSGSVLPDEMTAFIKGAYQNVAELKSVKLNLSCVDNLELAIGCMFSGIFAGVDGVKVSSLAGDLPSTDAFVKTLDAIGIKRGYNCKLNKTAVSRILKQITQISANKSSNTSFDNVVGESDDSVIKTITPTAIASLIKKRGYHLNAEDVSKVVAGVKRLATKKQVTIKELDVIIATYAMQVPETYHLESFSIQSSNVIPSVACIQIKKDGELLSGVSQGNGSVDAAFLAVESIIGRHFDLDDFQVYAVTEGKEAMAQTLVKLRNGGKLYSGSGISTDIVGASIRAYVSALNKIVYEENL